MPALIAGSSLSGASDLIASLAGDPLAVFEAAGIHPDVTRTPDRYLPLHSLSTLLGECASRMGVPDFALRLARLQTPEILGPLTVVARHATTIGAAIRSTSKYVHTYSPAFATELHQHARYSEFEFKLLARRTPYREHVTELALGVVLMMFKMSAGDEFRPTRINFTHQNMAELPTYREHFGAPVHFGQALNSLVFPSDLLDQRLTHADPIAHDFALRCMGNHKPTFSFLDTVFVLVSQGLPLGAAKLDSVATAMMIHPRTLQRRLEKRAYTFESLVDEVRREHALILLANGDIPLSAVANQLGYSEQSSLTRSCKRWFSETPLGKRRELSAALETGRSVVDR